jgi:lipopolysaccharide transport system permease protein
MASIREEMWKTKGILFNFAITDLKIRYKNSVLGVLWSILEPLLMLAVLFFVFSTMFKNEIEYFPIYLLSGLITYNFFKNGTTIALSSLSNRSSLITQIYFPRSIPAISSCFTSSIMLIVELAVLGIFMIYFQFTPPLTIFYLIPIYILAFVFVLGIALGLSVLNIKFRDIEFIWGIILHAGFFLTPIFYRFDFLPESVQNILQLSPVVQIVEMVHHVALYGTLPTLNSVLYSIGSVFAILGIGYLIFRKYQARIVEEL